MNEPGLVIPVKFWAVDVSVELAVNTDGAAAIGSATEDAFTVNVNKESPAVSRCVIDLLLVVSFEETLSSECWLR
jgi:hypothetical protein